MIDDRVPNPRNNGPATVAESGRERSTRRVELTRPVSGCTPASSGNPVPSSGSSADPHRVARLAVTEVAGPAPRLAKVHDRLAAAQGNVTDAQSAFQRGLAEIERLPLSYERALLELAYGQVLRRAGQRRAAASQL